MSSTTKWQTPSHLGSGPCMHQQACNFAGFCLKNQNPDNFKKGDGLSWLDASYRIGPRYGFTEDVGIIGGTGVLTGVPSASAFNPPQFGPSLYREGEWVLTGNNIIK